MDDFTGEETATLDPSIFDAGMTDESNGNGSDYVESQPQEQDKDKEERAPVKIVPRANAADFFSLLYGLTGTYLERTGKDIAVGRTLQFQAPLAGNKWDEIIANTWADRIIQPFVRKAEFMETMWSLVAMPVLVGLYERRPETAPMMEPMLREVIMNNLESMVPVLRDKMKQERKTARAVADLNDVLHIDKGDDPVDAVLASIFRPIEGMENEQPPE